MRSGCNSFSYFPESVLLSTPLNSLVILLDCFCCLLWSPSGQHVTWSAASVELSESGKSSWPRLRSVGSRYNVMTSRVAGTGSTLLNSCVRPADRSNHTTLDYWTYRFSCFSHYHFWSQGPDSGIHCLICQGRGVEGLNPCQVFCRPPPKHTVKLYIVVVSYIYSI